MKNIIIPSFLLSVVMSIPGVHAADVKLKRSCVKDNPLVKGVSDADLLSIYTQICDKKSKEQRDQNLILAAQRFQQLGMSDRALQIVNQLEAKQVNNPQLTDIKFLVGAHLAGDALEKMRDQESRLLTQDLTYPPAQILAENINLSVPSSIVALRKEEQKIKAAQLRALKKKQIQAGAHAQPKPGGNVNTKRNTVQLNVPNTQTNATPAKTSPFNGL